MNQVDEQLKQLALEANAGDVPVWVEITYVPVRAKEGWKPIRDILAQPREPVTSAGFFLGVSDDQSGWVIAQTIDKSKQNAHELLFVPFGLAIEGVILQEGVRITL